MGTRRDAAWVARHLGRAEEALFTDGDLELLARVLQRQDLEQSRVLFSEGERPPGVWILQTAWVALVTPSDRGRGVLAALGPRQCVGDGILLRDVPAPYRARVVAGGSALFLAGEDFRRLLSTNIHVAVRWASKLAGAMARMQGRVVELLGHGLQQQVARVLLHEGEDGTFPFSQEMCAALLGATRSSVNQVLKQLESQGVVRLSYGQIEVVDKSQIVRLAGEQPPESP